MCHSRAKQRQDGIEGKARGKAQVEQVKNKESRRIPRHTKGKAQQRMGHGSPRRSWGRVGRAGEKVRVAVGRVPGSARNGFLVGQTHRIVPRAFRVEELEHARNLS